MLKTILIVVAAIIPALLNVLVLIAPSSTWQKAKSVARWQAHAWVLGVANVIQADKLRELDGMSVPLIKGDSDLDGVE